MDISFLWGGNLNANQKKKKMKTYLVLAPISIVSFHFPTVLKTVQNQALITSIEDLFYFLILTVVLEA